MMILLILVILALQCTIVYAVPLALGGYDVVSCASKEALLKGKCDVMGLQSMSTQYTSVDSAGNPIFTSEFRFANQENMIAFENAPFTFAPRLGGFCGNYFSNMNETKVWSASALGPPVDLIHSWRAVKSSEGLPPSIYLFGGEDGAEEFMKGLPESQIRAEAAWKSFFGAHGTVAPYALSAGPFNSACFTAGDPNATAPPRDCAEEPISVPALK